MKLAKKGMLPSQIGVVLRDSHGVTQVNAVTGSKILRILKGQGLAPAIPEDLYHLIKKAVSMRKHMEANRKDKDSKFRLILVESRIHRLARYYKVLWPSSKSADCGCVTVCAEPACLTRTTLMICHCPISTTSKQHSCCVVQKAKKLPPTWKYESATASALVA